MTRLIDRRGLYDCLPSFFSLSDFLKLNFIIYFIPFKGFDTNIPEALCMVCFVDDIMPRGDFTWYPCVQLDVRFFLSVKRPRCACLFQNQSGNSQPLLNVGVGNY